MRGSMSAIRAWAASTLYGVLLAVEIGQTNFIIVDEIQSSYPAAGQRFHGKAPYPADAKDGNTGLGQAFHSLCAKEESGAGILIQHSR